MLIHFHSKPWSVLRSAAILLCFAVLQLQTRVASAGVVIQVPVGLKPDAHFRIIFVTSGTIDATSNNIADYNAFVNSQAQGATFNGQVIHWSAIASTDSVNALMNTDSYSSAAIYMVDGRTQISSAYSDATRASAGGLWSCALLAQPTQGIDGTVYNNATVWTGTSGNGIEYATNIFGSYGLGTQNYGTNPNTGINVFSTPKVQIGFISASQTGSNWVQLPNISATNTPGLQTRTNLYQMYAISDDLTLLPEPSTLLSTGVGLLVMVLVATSRRKKLSHGLTSEFGR